MEKVNLKLKEKFSKLIFWKNKKSHGIIDYISPFKINGWFKGINDISEIQLRINNEIILKTFTNQYRKDVCTKLGCEGNFGFSFELNEEFNDLEINNISIIAQFNKHIFDELIYKNSPKLTQDLIKSIFSNKLYGSEGHVDEINEEGIINGWAYNFIKNEPISIWIHSSVKSNKPEEVICNQKRYDLYQKGININCGFRYDLNLTSKFEINEILYFSFDKEGLLKIPCEKILQNPVKTNLKNIEIINENKDTYSDIYFQSKIQKSDVYIKKNWENLQKISNHINTIDEFINQEISKKSKKNIFFRLLNKFNKNK